MTDLEAGQQSLLRLPNELLEGILFCTPDATILVRVALLCRRMYDIFKRNKDNIVSTVLTACIGATVLPEALLALQCTPPILNTDIVVEGDWSVEQVTAQTNYASHFCQNMREARESRSKYRMGQAIALCDFHEQVVRPLQERFIASRTSSRSRLNFPQLRKSLNARPLSQLEKERICRSLYRFEIYRKLYGCSQSSYPFADRSEDFFLQYAGWELAQLGCIHDFLAYEIIPIFQDVAANDIAWGAWKIEYDVGVEDGGIQHLLAAGLRNILQVANLRKKSYSARAAALTACGRPPVKHKPFLSVELSKLSYRIGANAAWRTSQKGSGLFSGKPFCKDGDQGPKKIWLRECGRSDCDSDLQLYHSVHDPQGKAARTWGHVLWDDERHRDLVPAETWIYSWKAAGQKGSYLRRGVWENLVPANPKAWYTRFTDNEMRSSWAARAKLYAAGSRGHWKEGVTLEASASPRGVDQAATDGIKTGRAEQLYCCS